MSIKWLKAESLRHKACVCYKEELTEMNLLLFKVRILALSFLLSAFKCGNKKEKRSDPGICEGDFYLAGLLKIKESLIKV